MSGQRTMLSGLLMAALLLACFAPSAGAADKDKDKEKNKGKKEDPADYFKPTPAYEASRQQAHNIADQIEAEVAMRNVPIPPQMNLELDWYSPFIKLGETGKVLRGWVREELVLLETDKQFLLAIRRDDGVEKWRCQLNDTIRYAPVVSRNNVVVNCNNNLIAVEKQTGDIRWRLSPNFVMSCEPLVIDPPAYPREYTKAWVNLEHIYVGGWDGRFYYMTVRGRMVQYVKHITEYNSLAAPEFDLYYHWHKTHENRGVITTPIKVRDNILYYTADDQNVCAVTREGEVREPYMMQGIATTGTTVTGSTAANVSNSMLSSVFVGARDNSVYCLDRLTLKKKWFYPAGFLAHGTIMADEPATPFVYVSTNNNKLHALQVTPARIVTKGGPETPETFSHAWEVKGDGAVTASRDIVYVGHKREKEFPGFTGLSAVEKATGKVLWTDEDPKSFFTHYLEFHNNWGTPSSAARVYALTADNRLVSLKEKVKDTALKVVKVPEPEAPAPTKPEKKKPADGAAPAENK